MATQYIKYAKKCLKIFFSTNYRGAMAPFGQEVATPMNPLTFFENSFFDLFVSI